jgi:hypothetical protein
MAIDWGQIIVIAKSECPRAAPNPISRPMTIWYEICFLLRTSSGAPGWSALRRPSHSTTRAAITAHAITAHGNRPVFFGGAIRVCGTLIYCHRLAPETIAGQKGPAEGISGPLRLEELAGP